MDPRSRAEHGGCDPEALFELADGALGPRRGREVRAHLEDCPDCRGFYEREVNLNALLGSLDGSPEDQGACPASSVCQAVAMALPTRPARARVLWAALASVLLAVALIAFVLDGNANPFIPVAGALGDLWGFVLGLEDVLQAMFAAAGRPILTALAVGAALDVIIASALLSASRRRARAV